MNNNVNERYFDWLPKNKTVFELEKRILTSFNLGELTPLDFFEGLPGDTFNFAADSLIRFSSPLVKPAFERFNFHYKVFSVPLRILYDNFKKVMGERDDYEKKTDLDYKIPLIEFVDDNGQPVNNYAKNILAYFGVPLPTAADIAAGRTLSGLNKMLSNAYAMIHNEHFRDQNLQQAKQIDKSDNNIKVIAENDPNADYHTSAPDKYTGKLAHVNRNFDYFSNVFNDTQKGETVLLSLAGTAPVIVGVNENPKFTGNNLKWTTNTGRPLDNLGTGYFGISTEIDNVKGSLSTTISKNNIGNGPYIVPSNLETDLTGVSTLSINDLREVEKLQKRKELDLVAGTRYYEIVNNYFDVKNALAQLDYPTLIASSLGTVEISQVVQTSAQTVGTSTAQGNVAGYAVDANDHGQVNTTLNEHSLIIPMVYITQNHTYQQGLNKFFKRRSKNDFFDPLQIGLGFQPIMKSEIYGHLEPSKQNDTWAFAPQAERMRKSTDIVSGMLNAGAKNAISQWHAGDYYDGAPNFDATWKIETPKYLDNILIFPSTTVDNFILDIKFTGLKITTVDPMGVPSL